MTRSRLATSAVLALFGPAFLQACDRSLPSAPSSAHPALQNHAPRTRLQPRLAVCGARVTESVSGTIGPEGGALRLGGHSLVIPAGALSSPTDFSLRSPAGRHLRIEILAGAAESLHLAVPAEVTISYERCERQKMSGAQAWTLDTQTGATLSTLDSNVDLEFRSVTFYTSELPDDALIGIARGIYAVAY